MVSVLPQLQVLKGAALDFLFPRFCVGCGKEGTFICNSCEIELPRIEAPFCQKCGQPLAGREWFFRSSLPHFVQNASIGNLTLTVSVHRSGSKASSVKPSMNLNTGTCGPLPVNWRS